MLFQTPTFLTNPNQNLYYKDSTTLNWVMLRFCYSYVIDF